MECWGSLRTSAEVLKSSCAPDVLEQTRGQEAFLTESPTGIAFGISGDIQSCLSSDLDGLNLMGSLMGPKSFLEGL